MTNEEWEQLKKEVESKNGSILGIVNGGNPMYYMNNKTKDFIFPGKRKEQKNE